MVLTLTQVPLIFTLTLALLEKEYLGRLTQGHGSMHPLASKQGAPKQWGNQVQFGSFTGFMLFGLLLSTIGGVESISEEIEGHTTLYDAIEELL
jgi:hypothetical protein